MRSSSDDCPPLQSTTSPSGFRPTCPVNLERSTTPASNLLAGGGHAVKNIKKNKNTGSARRGAHRHALAASLDRPGEAPHPIYTDMWARLGGGVPPPNPRRRTRRRRQSAPGEFSSGSTGTQCPRATSRVRVRGSCGDRQVPPLVELVGPTRGHSPRTRTPCGRLLAMTIASAGPVSMEVGPPEPVLRGGCARTRTW